MHIPHHPFPCIPTAHPHHTWLWLQLCNSLPIPRHCAVVDTEHPRTQAASAALCQRCGLSALSPRGCCPCCPPEAVCFTICEHQEEMKQWWRIPFSKALMVKNVLLGCLFHRREKKEKKVGEGGGRRDVWSNGICLPKKLLGVMSPAFLEVGGHLPDNEAGSSNVIVSADCFPCAVVY